MSREALSMSDKKYDEISHLVHKTYPNSCILFIDKIYNYELEQKYFAVKKKIEEKRGHVTELEAFHGTHAQLIDIIIEEGFDPSKNLHAAYGPGTYFARDAIYSFSYMKSNDVAGISYMFLCDIAIGKIKTYNNDYDNTANAHDVNQATIYVCPMRDQCIPRYVIAFHKNAK